MPKEPTYLKYFIQKWVQRCLRTLICAQIVIGLIIIILSEYYSHLMGKYLPYADNSAIFFNIIFIQIFGGHIVLNYLCGLPLVHRCSKQMYSRDLVALLKFWNLFAFSLSVDGIFVFFMWSKSIEYTQASIVDVLFKGMLEYYSNAEWRLRWDGFQYNEQCCGVTNYRDWQLNSTELIE